MPSSNRDIILRAQVVMLKFIFICLIAQSLLVISFIHSPEVHAQERHWVTFLEQVKYATSTLKVRSPDIVLDTTPAIFQEWTITCRDPHAIIEYKAFICRTYKANSNKAFFKLEANKEPAELKSKIYFLSHENEIFNDIALTIETDTPNKDFDGCILSQEDPPIELRNTDIESLGRRIKDLNQKRMKIMSHACSEPGQ